MSCYLKDYFIICGKVDKGLCSALSTFRLTKFNPNSLVATWLRPGGKVWLEITISCPIDSALVCHEISGTFVPYILNI